MTNSASTSVTLSSPLPPTWEEDEEKSTQEENVMAGGFLRPDYMPPPRSAPAHPKSREYTPAQRFTAWRGILRFRKSQQNLKEMADDE